MIIFYKIAIIVIIIITKLQIAERHGLYVQQEEFEDTKGVIRIRKSKKNR